MDDYYNQRQPLLQQHGQQYGHIPPPQYNVGPPPQYDVGPPPPQHNLGPPLQPYVQCPGTIPTYQGGYPAAYPVGLTQQPAPSPPYHGNPTYNNNIHGYYHQPQPPQAAPPDPMPGDYPLPDPHQIGALPLPPQQPPVNTNFRFSLCLCITCTILLALPGILLTTCALICSIQSKRLENKGEYDEAKKKGTYAKCLSIISIPAWVLTYAFTALILIEFESVIFY